MAARGAGSVVFIASVNGLAHYGNAAYAAAKAGLIAYAKALAVERGRRGVRVNVVCPGSVRTQAWDHRFAQNPDLAERLLPHYPLGRLVEAAEVARRRPVPGVGRGLRHHRDGPACRCGPDRRQRTFRHRRHHRGSLSMAGLRIKQLVKRFGPTPVLHGIDLDVTDGEFVVLVGPSGCGKSTLLRMIAGLDDISAGELWIGDRLANRLAPQHRNISMVFQSYALFPHMSVRDNVGFGPRIRREAGGPW